MTRAYRDLIEAGVPDELGGGVLFLTGPPEDFVPTHLQGKRLVAAAAIYAGTEAEARALFGPMFDLAPEGMMVAELPYVGIQSALDDPPGFRNYWSGEHLHSFPDAAVEVFYARSKEMLSPEPSQQILIPWGGAVGRDVERWPPPHHLNQNVVPA